jgi:hypothetical protein
LSDRILAAGAAAAKALIRPVQDEVAARTIRPARICLAPRQSPPVQAD